MITTPAELEQLAKQIADRVTAQLSRRRLVDRVELAELLGISVPTVDRQVRCGKIPVVRIGRRILFDPTKVIEAFSNSCETKTPEIDTIGRD